MSKDLIDAETEDTIYNKHQFVKNLQKVVDREVEEVIRLVLKDIEKNSENTDYLSEEKVRDWVFDYMHNCDELLSLEEYVGSFNATLD